jgi:uncharacterized protein with HEPN domain
MHSSKRAFDALLDIQDAIASVEQFTQGLSFDAFSTSRLHYWATLRGLEIISEAIRRLPEDMQARHPHLNWPAMRAIGNVLRHGYDKVEERIIWNTVHDDLPGVSAMVTAELAAAEHNASISDNGA